MNRKKRFLSLFAIILALVISLALFACNPSDDNSYNSHFEITREIVDEILPGLEFGNRVFYKSGYDETGYDITENGFVLYKRYSDHTNTYQSYCGNSGDGFIEVTIKNPDSEDAERSYTQLTKWEAEQKLNAEKTYIKDQVNLIYSDDFVHSVEFQKEYGSNFGKLALSGNAQKEEGETVFESAFFVFTINIVESNQAANVRIEYEIQNKKLKSMRMGANAEVEGYIPDNLRPPLPNNDIESFEFEYDRALSMPSDKGTNVTPTGLTDVYMQNTTLPPRTQQAKGSKITLATPEGEGFLGWYYDSAFKYPIEGQFQIGFAEYYQVYAKWQVPAIKTQLNGGTLSTNAQSRLADCVRVWDIWSISPYKAGQIFEGWYTDAAFQNRASSNNNLINADTTVYAKWQNPVSITLSATGITYTLPKLIGAAGSSMFLDDVVPTKKGSIFAGWYKDSAFANAVTETTFPANNTTYYAKFTDAICVEIIFDEDATLTIDYDYYTNIPKTPSAEFGFAELLEHIGTSSYIGGENPDGESFAGWYTDSARTTQLTAYPTASIKLYPKIAAQYYYTLNAGEGTLEESYEYDKGHRLINNLNALQTPIADALSNMASQYIIAPEGKSFAGWYTDAALTTAYNPTSYTLQNITLYASYV